jgi:protein phosphatase
MTTWEIAHATHVGNVREANEDALLVTPTVAMVADGMGGHAAGEVASALAVATFPTKVANARGLDDLAVAVASTNENILADAAANPSREGMGTTLVALVHIPLENGTAVALVNIGDSRCYRVRNGKITQLTHDHSWAEEMVRMGRMTPDEAIVHPRRHQLTRVLGMHEGATPDVSFIEPEVGDVYVLCSDGLSNEVATREINAIVTGAPSLEAATSELVSRALEHGGRDNVSVALVRMTSVDTVVVPTITTPSDDSVKTRQRRPLTTLSAATFVGALVMLVVLALVFLNWYGRQGYFVGEDSHHVVRIYKGQPGGFMWMKPVEQPFGGATVTMSQLSNYDQQQVHAGMPEASLSAAISYYAQLQMSAQSQLPSP